MSHASSSSSSAVTSNSSLPNSPNTKNAIVEFLRCAICYHAYNSPHLCPSCSNMACFTCFYKWLNHSTSTSIAMGHNQASSCPFCRNKLQMKQLIPIRFLKDIEKLWQEKQQEVEQLSQQHAQHCDAAATKQAAPVPASSSSLPYASLPCQHHPHEMPRYFCVTCSDVLCSDCVIASDSQHKCHSVEKLNNKLHNMRSDIEQQLHIMHTKSNEYAKKQHDIQAEWRNFHSAAQLQQKSMVKRHDDMRERYKKKLNNIKNKYMTRENEMIKQQQLLSHVHDNVHATILNPNTQLQHFLQQYQHVLNMLYDMNRDTSTNTQSDTNKHDEAKQNESKRDDSSQTTAISSSSSLSSSFSSSSSSSSAMIERDLYDLVSDIIPPLFSPLNNTRIQQTLFPSSTTTDPTSSFQHTCTSTLTSTSLLFTIPSFHALRTSIIDASSAPATLPSSSSSTSHSPPSSPSPDFVYSSSFFHHGLEWRLKFYPNGNQVAQNAYISIFLELSNQHTWNQLFNKQNENDTNHHSYEYTIELIHPSSNTDSSSSHSSPNASHSSSSSSSSPPSHIKRIYVSKFEIGESWGYNRFYRIDQLENDGYLKDGTLQLRLSLRANNYSTYAQQQDNYIHALEERLAQEAQRKNLLVDYIKELGGDSSRIAEIFSSCDPAPAAVATASSSPKQRDNSQGSVQHASNSVEAHNNDSDEVKQDANDNQTHVVEERQNDVDGDGDDDDDNDEHEDDDDENSDSLEDHAHDTISSALQAYLNSPHTTSASHTGTFNASSSLHHTHPSASSSSSLLASDVHHAQSSQPASTSTRMQLVGRRLRELKRKQQAIRNLRRLYNNLTSDDSSHVDMSHSSESYQYESPHHLHVADFDDDSSSSDAAIDERRHHQDYDEHHYVDMAYDSQEEDEIRRFEAIINSRMREYQNSNHAEIMRVHESESDNGEQESGDVEEEQQLARLNELSQSLSQGRRPGLLDDEYNSLFSFQHPYRPAAASGSTASASAAAAGASNSSSSAASQSIALSSINQLTIDNVQPLQSSSIQTLAQHIVRQAEQQRDDDDDDDEEEDDEEVADEDEDGDDDNDEQVHEEAKTSSNHESVTESTQPHWRTQPYSMTIDDLLNDHTGSHYDDYDPGDIHDDDVYDDDDDDHEQPSFDHNAHYVGGASDEARADFTEYSD